LPDPVAPERVRRLAPGGKPPIRRGARPGGRARIGYGKITPVGVGADDLLAPLSDRSAVWQIGFASTRASASRNHPLYGEQAPTLRRGRSTWRPAETGPATERPRCSTRPPASQLCQSVTGLWMSTFLLAYTGRCSLTGALKFRVAAFSLALRGWRHAAACIAMIQSLFAGGSPGIQAITGSGNARNKHVVEHIQLAANALAPYLASPSAPPPCREKVHGSPPACWPGKCLRAGSTAPGRRRISQHDYPRVDDGVDGRLGEARPTD